MGRIIRGLVERRLTAVICGLLDEEPVVVLSGPRAVGKSTLLQGVAATLDCEIIDLDDVGVRQGVAEDPAIFASGPPPVLVDEFQKVPELLDAIKAELNRSLSPGRYILAGSTRYDTLPRAAQSLTGRAHVTMVWPLSQGEIAGRHETFVERLLDDPGGLVEPATSHTTREDYIERVAAGGYPIALTRTGTSREHWFASYIRRVCERDVLDISRIRQRDQLPRLLQRLAGQTAQLLNMAEAARASRLERSTAENYAQLLEAVHLFYRLPAWGTTVMSKAGASPKVHLVDSGLGAYLLRLTPEKLARRSAAALSIFGHLLETFVIGEILKQVSWYDGVVAAGHWRTRDDVEVDLVLERSDGAVAGVEVKSSSRIGGAELRHLTALADRLGDEWIGGVVLYMGARSYTYDRARSIHVLPIDRIWA